MKLTRREIQVIPKRGESSLVPAMVSPSGRWGMYRYPPGKGMTVVHVPTGLAVRRTLLQKEARALIEALEEIPTPHIDTQDFGEQGSSREEKDELILLLHKIKGMIRAGEIR